MTNLGAGTEALTAAQRRCLTRLVRTHQGALRARMGRLERDPVALDEALQNIFIDVLPNCEWLVRRSPEQAACHLDRVARNLAKAGRKRPGAEPMPVTRPSLSYSPNEVRSRPIFSPKIAPLHGAGDPAEATLLLRQIDARLYHDASLADRVIERIEAGAAARNGLADAVRRTVVSAGTALAAGALLTLFVGHSPSRSGPERPAAFAADRQAGDAHPVPHAEPRLRGTCQGRFS